jgi:predicted nucleic acid-binding protein
VNLVYDAGVLIAAEAGAERVWALHKRALECGVEPVLPAPVLTEVWRAGARAHKLAEFIASCVVEELTEERAKAAGVLLANAAHGVVDAVVTECALRRGAACLTGNRAHISELAEPMHLHIIDI